MNSHPTDPTKFSGSDLQAAGALTGSRAVAWGIVSALALRGLAWFFTDPVTFDSALYFEMGDLIWNGRWADALAYDYPPLYPLLIAGLQPVLGSAEAAGFWISLLADLLLLWPIVAIARRAVGGDAAWAAAFLWAVHISAIRLGVQALTDAPTAMCVSAAVAAGLRALDHARIRWAVAAGLASGFAFLFRPEGLEPAVALAVLYAFARWQGFRRSARANEAKADGQLLSGPRAPSRRAALAARHAGWILAPLAGWALIAGPYVVYISAEAGAPTLSKKKSAVGFVRSAVPLAGAESRDQQAAGRERARQEGSPIANRVRRWAHNVYVFQKPLVNGLTAVVIVPVCVGWAGFLARRRDRWNPALGLLGGLFVLHFAILVGLAADLGAAYLGRHHFLLLTVYALPVAGGGLTWILGWMGRRFGGRQWVPVMALGAIVVATGLAVATRGPDQGSSVRAAAAWIRAQVAGTPIIVTTYANLTYHANAKRVDLRGSYDDILRRARERSAHFVAFYPDRVADTSPDFLARLSPADLELAQVFSEATPAAPHRRLELYRVLPGAGSGESRPASAPVGLYVQTKGPALTESR